MKTLTCPHCHARVPHGATVCRGCKAELEYGTPAAAYLIPLIVACCVAWLVLYGMYHLLHIASHEVYGWVGWIVFLGVFICVTVRVNKSFADRVVYHRIYRTDNGNRRSHVRSR